MRPRFLRDTLSLEAYAGTGARGPVYGTPVTIRASVQPEFRLMVDAQGRQFQAQALAIVYPGVEFPVESRVTTSDGKVYRVLADNPLPDLARADHREILLGGLQ